MADDRKKSDDSAKKSAAAKKAADTRSAKADAADRPAAKSEGALAREQQAAKDVSEREQLDVAAARKQAADEGRNLPTDQATGSQGLKPQPNDPVDAPVTPRVEKDVKAEEQARASGRKRKAEHVTIKLRDDNDVTHEQVARLAVLNGATDVSHGKLTVKVEVPRGTDRSPASARESFVRQLDADPNVVEVTT